MKVKIGNKQVGENEPCFISLEPGATYNNFDDAKEMIKFVSESGADAIKFQTFTPGDADRIMGKKDITVDFKTSSGKNKELVYDALKRRELTVEEWKELVNYAKKLNLLFISAPYFPETVELLKKLQIDAIKVSKGDINNVILIDLIAKTNLPVILDAREKLEDIEKAISICEKNGNKKIIIMHCPSGYPAESSGVHLNAIPFLSKKFEYPVAYADHSPGDTMNYAAVAMGAKMLEKTITKNKNIEQVEHFMSLELDELKDFVQNIRAVEQAIGNPDILDVSRVEESARRSLVSKSLIKAGQEITRDLLDFQRPGDAGISCAEGFKVLEKKAACDIPKGTFLQWDMIQ